MGLSKNLQNDYITNPGSSRESHLVVANTPTVENQDLATEHLHDAHKENPQIGKGFGPGAGRVSYGTKTPTIFQGFKDKVIGPEDPLTGRFDPNAVTPEMVYAQM